MAEREERKAEVRSGSGEKNAGRWKRNKRAPTLMEMGKRGRSQLKLSLLLEYLIKLLIFAVYREPIQLIKSWRKSVF